MKYFVNSKFVHKLQQIINNSYKQYLAIESFG